MKILFAGGGTAGHINPALAIAGYVKQQQPQAEILYVGAKGGMEGKLVPKAGYAYQEIAISGFQRKLNWEGFKKNLRTLKLLVTSSAASKKIIRSFAPDICVGTGGYVSGPVLRAAAKLGVPIVIHEQNAYPGVTNKMLAKYASKVFLTVEDAKKYLPQGCPWVVTGNPVRAEFLTAQREEARKKLRLDTRPVILSFGGSLGARKINEAVADLIAWSAKEDRYQHIHAYGQYGKWFPQRLEEKGVRLAQHPNLDIREYIDDIADCFAAADLVICRAGAGTLSELQAQGRASILIPSPNVAENHQYHNAMALVRRQAASILEEKDLTGQRLISMVDEMVSHPDVLRAYQANAKKMAITDSSERIYRGICEVLSKK
ncbi:MAG TPA: undecaprenyldiphospho-muramoylpentapeptide beta-N-acetylglucosaminyltransferase [Candidatus Gallacutalibacter stercoravium]|nr:undecaprenyldiphospho-muramoylpentapeptide beta-N-acetylglucosaminyltransferase [Candidatus Gallacutalibacter stercoravium]